MRDSTPRSGTGAFSGAPRVHPADQAAEGWMRRLQAGLTLEEEMEFAEWLAADPQHEICLRKYQAAWARFEPLVETLAPAPAFEGNSSRGADDSAARPAFAGRRASRPRWIVPALGIAASITLLLLVASRERTPGGNPPQAFQLPALCEQRTLPDGSVVELNRGARITVRFTEAERRVTLDQGEATFTVEKNPLRPFVVTAGAVGVRAVGTAFNVRFDPRMVEVLVTEGKVRVENGPANPASPAGGDEAGTFLTAGQKMSFAASPAGPPPQVAMLTPAQVDAHLAWRPKMLDFDDAPLSAIIAEFNRRNSVRLVITDPVIADRRMTATFRSDNLEGFVRLIEASIGVRATQLNEGEIDLVRK
jgi:transmembrane sensor